jgi:hypothetical protein
MYPYLLCTEVEEGCEGSTLHHASVDQHGYEEMDGSQSHNDNMDEYQSMDNGKLGNHLDNDELIIIIIIINFISRGYTLQ